MRRSELVLDIRPGRAEDSDLLVQDGWGDAEGGHRWALGGASTIWLPVASLGDDCVLVVDMAPWCDQIMRAQSVTLALNGHVLATVQCSDQRALAFRCPPAPCGLDGAALSFTHHDAARPRAAEGYAASGAPLGERVFSIRVFRLHLPSFTLLTTPSFPVELETGALADAVLRKTGLTPESLVSHFEGIGHNCEFGLVQRALGLEPIALLRFASVVTCRLYDSLISGFAGAGDPENIDILTIHLPDPEFQIHETLHGFFYRTLQSPEQTTPDELRAKHSVHLRIVQRKFLETLQSGEKIFAVSRARNLTPPEALAIWCALNLHADNDLLWALNGDPSQTGRVDALLPGFFRGHLGATDADKYGSVAAWISLMANAWMLRQGHGEPAIFADS